MIKPELLAPAGDLNTLKVALETGADAVYIGGKNFGARYFASNFSNEELEEAIKFAHERLKKVYITVNTIIYDNEFDSLKDYIDFLYQIKVDAIIVQDLGIISYVRTKYPDFEVHASTQMNVFSAKAIKILTELGVKRVVLARETPYSIVKELTKCGLEIEVFVHGALCFCSSGNCLMSYSIGSRSGNRGKCAQPCRKTYTLFENDLKISKQKAILSMKDLCTIDKIEQLIATNVTSFKIEGRMKSSEYVYSVVKGYRQAIDNVLLNKTVSLDDEIKDMKIMFNRKFTDGYLFNESNKEITNIDSVNHQGIRLGKIHKINPNSFELKLEEELWVQDAIRIVGDKEIGFNVQIMFVNGEKRSVAKKGEIVKIPCDDVNKVLNKVVLLTKSARIQQELKEYLKTEHLKSPIDLVFELKLNQKASLELIDGNNRVKVLSNDIITNLSNNELNDEFYFDKLNKFTSTPFYINNFNIKNDKISYISVKELNEMRRKAVDELLKLRLLLTKDKQELNLISNKFPKLSNQIEIIVHNKEQYDACISLGFNNIYTDYKSNQMSVSRLSDNVYDNQMVHNIGQIGTNVIASPYFNVTNKEAIKLLNHLGASKIYLSYEMDINNLEDYSDLNLNIGIPVYGKMDVMITKHCPISKNKGHLYKNCNACCGNSYYLLDEYNNKFDIIPVVSSDCSIRILDYKVYNNINQIEKLSKKGINLFLLTFTTETSYEVKKILEKLM